MCQQKNPALPSLSMLAHFPRIHPRTETPSNLQTSMSDLHSRLLNPSAAKFQRRQVVRSTPLLCSITDHSTARSRIYKRRYSRERKPPSVILYTKQQLTDLSICISPDNRHPSVLGVDRTFNLGACFVTLFVYKNPKMNRRSTQEPAILVGPMHLHSVGWCIYHIPPIFLTFTK